MERRKTVYKETTTTVSVGSRKDRLYSLLLLQQRLEHLYSKGFCNQLLDTYYSTQSVVSDT